MSLADEFLQPEDMLRNHVFYPPFILIYNFP